MSNKECFTHIRYARRNYNVRFIYLKDKKDVHINLSDFEKWLAVLKGRHGTVARLSYCQGIFDEERFRVPVRIKTRVESL